MPDQGGYIPPAEGHGRMPGILPHPHHNWLAGHTAWYHIFKVPLSNCGDLTEGKVDQFLHVHVHPVADRIPQPTARWIQRAHRDPKYRLLNRQWQRIIRDKTKSVTLRYIFSECAIHLFR